MYLIFSNFPCLDGIWLFVSILKHFLRYIHSVSQIWTFHTFFLSLSKLFGVAAVHWFFPGETKNSSALSWQKMRKVVKGDWCCCFGFYRNNQPPRPTSNFSASTFLTSICNRGSFNAWCFGGRVNFIKHVIQFWQVAWKI